MRPYKKKWNYFLFFYMTTISDTRHEYLALLLLSKTANDMGLLFFLLFPHIDPTF